MIGNRIHTLTIMMTLTIKMANYSIKKKERLKQGWTKESKK